MKGVVYVLTNEAMPGLVKIGRATDINLRMRQLYTSGVPIPFVCEFAGIVEDSVTVERALHTAFGDKRLHDRREFFELEAYQAIAVLKLLVSKDVTPNVKTPEVTEDELRAVQRTADRRKNFNFQMVNIPIGAEIRFVDHPEITARVASKSKIEFEGEITSTSAAAAKVLSRQGFNWVAVQGPQYWVYEDERLTERRHRMELEED